MPHEPKKRHSKQRQGKRRAAIKLSPVSKIDCPNCKRTIQPHTVCKYCGYYRGKKVLFVKTKSKE